MHCASNTYIDVYTTLERIFILVVYVVQILVWHLQDLLAFYVVQENKLLIAIHWLANY